MRRDAANADACRTAWTHRERVIDMSEQIYQQVEMAIKNHLHIIRPGCSALGGALYGYPEKIEYGNIVMRDSDCGLAKQTFLWTTDQWANAARYGLYKQVGFWAFARYDDPATGYIAMAHSSPEYAGRRIHELTGKLKALGVDI